MASSEKVKRRQQPNIHLEPKTDLGEKLQVQAMSLLLNTSARDWVQGHAGAIPGSRVKQVLVQGQRNLSKNILTLHFNSQHKTPQQQQQ